MVKSNTAKIAKGAIVLGDVTLGENVGIWYNAVIRADGGGKVVIGNGSNVQDCSVLHLDMGGKVIIGENVTVGHSAVVHGCTIGDNVIVGMGSIIMNGAKIGNNCIIGAGALVTQGKEIPDGSLVMGVPGKVIRQLTDEEKVKTVNNAKHYVDIVDTIIED